MAQQAEVSVPQKRIATLDLARTLLTTKPVDISDEEISKKNPFDPIPPPVEVAESGQAAMPAAVVNGDRERLIGIAGSISPSGTVLLGGSPILLFGQKKFKVGDHLTITFQGAVYELEITAIDRTNFTLRLNNEEITRPIKPVVNKQ